GGARAGVPVGPRAAFVILRKERLAVRGAPAVAQGGGLGGEDRREVAVRVAARQGLVEDAGAVLVLGADGEVGVQVCRPLPPERLERAAAALLGRLVHEFALRLGDAGGGEHLGGQRGGEAQPDHQLNEAAAAHTSRL